MVSRTYCDRAFLQYLTRYSYLRSGFRSSTDYLCPSGQHTRENPYPPVLIFARNSVHVAEHHIFCGEAECSLLAGHCVYIRAEPCALALGIAENDDREPGSLFKGESREEMRLVDMRKTRYHNGHTGHGSRCGTVFRQLPCGIEKIFHSVAFICCLSFYLHS